jgi:epsin
MAGPPGALDKLKSVDWRGLVRTATNKAKMYVLNLSPLEVLVEEATNTETWGPHGSMMAEIAEACFDPEGYRQVLGVLARRLQEGGERWRCAYKALLLLEHLVKHGPPKAAADVAASRSVLERLQKFEYKDANGRDHGANVRHRAAEIAALVAAPQRVAEEREKAAANKAKYTGVSGGASRSASGFGGAPGGGGAPRRFDPASLVRPGGATGGAAGGAYDAAGGGGGGGGGGGYRGGGGGYGGGGRDSGAVDEWGRSPHSSAPPRPPAAEARYGSGGGAGASPRGADPVAATRARIERLKLSEAAGARAADGGAAPPPRKLLADVRVNPKIAASLGLKLPAAPRAAAASAVAPLPAMPTAAPAAAGGADLLSGLLDAPPAAGGAAAAWDLFGAGPAPPAAPAAPPAPGGGPAAGARPALGGGGGAFADLTGLHKAPVSMGARASPRASPGGAPAPAAAAPPPPPPAFAADFGAAFAADFGAAAPAAPPKAAGDPFADLLC